MSDQVKNRLKVQRNFLRNAAMKNITEAEYQLSLDNPDTRMLENLIILLEIKTKELKELDERYQEIIEINQLEADMETAIEINEKIIIGTYDLKRFIANKKQIISSDFKGTANKNVLSKSVSTSFIKNSDVKYTAISKSDSTSAIKGSVIGGTSNTFQGSHKRGWFQSLKRDGKNKASIGVNTMKEEKWVEDMKIRKASSSLQKDIFNGVYKMDSKPRGKCLLINNAEYDVGSKRLGSEFDVKALQNVFSQLHFDVEVHENLPTKEMNQVLDEYSKNQNYDQNDALIVIVMSHGYKDAVYGIDDEQPKLLPIKDIYKRFNGKNCPSLVDKPKLFFFQVCREEENQNRNFEIVKDASNIHDEVSDVLLCVNTVDCNESYDNEIRGSSFIQNLRNCLVEFASEKHLIEILNEVGKRVTAGNAIYRHCPSYVSLDFNKKLYFNPID